MAEKTTTKNRRKTVAVRVVVAVGWAVMGALAFVDGDRWETAIVAVLFVGSVALLWDALGRSSSKATSD